MRQTSRPPILLLTGPVKQVEGGAMHEPLMPITRLLKPEVVIELGPYDGRDSVRISEHCKQLSCVEGRSANAAETRRATASHAGRVAEVSVVDSEIQHYLTNIATALSRIDLIWARGVLYHFANPVEIIGLLGALRERHHCPVIGWTHLAEVATEHHEGHAGRWYNEDPSGSRLSSIGNPRSFWLTPDSFINAFNVAGFSNAAFLDYPKPHEANGGLVAYFVAGE